jgi:hypothetical protein
MRCTHGTLPLAALRSHTTSFRVMEIAPFCSSAQRLHSAVRSMMTCDGMVKRAACAGIGSMCPPVVLRSRHTSNDPAKGGTECPGR